MSPSPSRSSRASSSGTGRTRDPMQQLARLLGIVIALIIVALVARYCGFEQDIHFMIKDQVQAIDGDTLKSANAEVRLYGVDAPELYQICTEGDGIEWDCGRAAQAKLKSLIARRAVDCEPKSRDKFNRVVAVCYTSAIPDLGEALVREGFAVNFGVGDAPGPYSAAEADAQAAKRGLWRGTFDKPYNWRQAHPPEGK
jgi:endonuclease YncB( thermonuclease family)